MSEIKIGRMVLGSCQTNCYFLYREGQNAAIVVDPADQGDKIYDALERNGFQVAAILLTHGHFDHIWGCEKLRQAANAGAEKRGDAAVSVYACEDERQLLGSARMNVSEMAGRACTLNADVYVKDGQEVSAAGMTCKVIATPGHTAGGCCYYFEEPGFLRACTLNADVYVKDGQEVSAAGMTCKVIATPGHTAGGCCYYFEEPGFLLCGDTIFLESVGRTDFPTGSMGTLIRSIKEKIFTLPEETKLYPGHGDDTTVAHEKKYNPFCV